MKKVLSLLAFGLILTGCKNENKGNPNEMESETAEAADKVERDRETQNIDIHPIEHATAVITWEDAVFYTDPVGGAEAFEGQEKPDFILITDIHGDHMNAETLQGMDLDSTKIFAPQAVKDELPQEMHEMITVIANGSSEEFMGFKIEAVPMYNLPEDDPESRHTKGRGNGYVVEKNDTRLYISGDTEDIPEMRSLRDIDMALVCMNLPYTMDIEQAADAVLEFKPKQVYPYHFRGQDGLADVDAFKKMVEEESDDIEVVQLDWYPNED